MSASPPPAGSKRRGVVVAGAAAAIVAVAAAAIVLSTQGAPSVAENADSPTGQAASAGATGPAATDGASDPERASESAGDSEAAESDSTPRPGGPATRAGSVLVPDAPTSVVLPSGRTVPVRAVSTTRDGTLDVPDDIRQAGWWRGGSRLADPFGSTLIAGHIDSTTQGLGPFAELLQAQSGDRIDVGSNRLGQSFVVESLELVPRSTVNTLPRIFGPSGGRRLVLVTCAPPYLRDDGGYQNLALVTAVPASEPARIAR